MLKSVVVFVSEQQIVIYFTDMLFNVIIIIYITLSNLIQKLVNYIVLATFSFHSHIAIACKECAV